MYRYRVVKDRRGLPIHQKIKVRLPKVAGVYAILGPDGVYVGESTDCWNRSTLVFAVRLGLDCGIIREANCATKDGRLTNEYEVQELYKSRGFPIIYGDYTHKIKEIL